VAQRTRADRGQLADKARRCDAAFRAAVTGPNLRAWLSRNEAGLASLHGADLVARMVTIADQLLAELAVFDRSKKTRQTLARLLIERGADPRDILTAARRAAADKATSSPRALLTFRLRKFASTGDRSWLSGPRRKKAAPAAPAASSTPKPPAPTPDYAAADRAVGDALAFLLSQVRGSPA
jgi:hypothetical protein